MIDFVKKLIQALSDDEFEYFAMAIYDEKDRRLRVKIGNTPASADPCAQERELLKAGKNIEAMKHYQIRNGVSLKEAKDAIEECRKTLRFEG